MFKRTALMESISSNLHTFLKKTGNNLSLLDKKFLRDSLIGLIRCGKPIVCQMARQLPNQRTKFLSRLDRLESHLVKDSVFDNKIKSVLPNIWLPFVQDDTPIILDLSEATRDLKSQLNLEKIRTFRWLAIRRLVLLAVPVMIYLSWLVEEHPNICDRLVYLTQPLPDNPDFVAYRLSAGLTEAINTCFWLHKNLLRKSL